MMNTWLGVGGLLVGVISLTYSIYATRKSRREKGLAYQVFSAVPVADVISGESGYSLRVTYERPGEPPVYVERAVVQMLRFTSYGRIPIEKRDLVSGDPLRVEVVDGKVLDIALASVTRDACGISLGEVVVSEEKAYVAVDFDFLDYRDGALIQILTSDHEAQLGLRGTIVGLPGGPIRVEESEETDFSGISCLFPIILQVIALVSLPFLYRFLTGGWTRVWLLLLPFGPPLAAVAATVVLWPLIVRGRGPRLTFPAVLSPPAWHRARTFMSREFRAVRSRDRTDGIGTRDQLG